MDICFDSCFVMTQDAYALAAVPAVERKARPARIILDQSLPLTHDQQSLIDAYAVSPDFDSRPVSPVSVSDSECSESSQATDDTTASRTIGFGRKRHSVLPTVRPSDASKIVGFGRKQHHYRHSVSGTSSVALDRKQQNRRSLPTPVITRDAPFLADSKCKFDYRFSMDVGGVTLPVILKGGSDKRSGTARRVSNDSLSSSRRPPKPLLLPQQVQARDSPASPLVSDNVKQSFTFVVSRPVEFIVDRLAALRRLRLKRFNVGRPIDGEKNIERKSLLRRLRKLYRRLRGF